MKMLNLKMAHTPIWGRFLSHTAIGQLNDCWVFYIIWNFYYCVKENVEWMGGCGTTAGWKTSPYVHLLLGGKPQASCTPHSGLPGRAKNFEYFLSGFYTTIITIVIYLKIKRILNQDFLKIISQEIQTRCCKTLYFPQPNSCTRCPWCLLFLALVVHPLHYSLNEVLVLGACDAIQPTL